MLRATTKGVFPFRRIESDSRVWGSSPCIMSTTRMAMSHMEEPRTRRLLEGGREGEDGQRRKKEETEERRVF